MIKRFRPVPSAPVEMMAKVEIKLKNPYSKIEVTVPAGAIVPVLAKRRSHDGLVLCVISYSGVGGLCKERDLVPLEEVEE